MEVSGQLYTPAALLPGKEPWVLDRVLGGPQNRFWRGGEERNFQPCRESKPRTPIAQPVAQSYTDWAIMALATERISIKFGVGCYAKRCQVNLVLFHIGPIKCFLKSNFI
jgi:hypothetical protein